MSDRLENIDFYEHQGQPLTMSALARGVADALEHAGRDLPVVVRHFDGIEHREQRIVQINFEGGEDEVPTALLILTTDVA
jgi:hypothetical protein